ncbi:hypothetical protein BGY98DRAFT_283580 [Russula aff. rugulosa BPL654]|nr:hypothetical protein BGY98DRAFT_283580 [Russula aff. rugulosa BPL654]
MRRYDIVFGILLILSSIYFALAAPVLVQEKRQARVDVVHIPRDVIAVLWKRGDEELAKLAEGYFKPLGELVTHQRHTHRRAQRRWGPTTTRRTRSRC